MARGTTQTQSTQTRFRDKVMDQHDIPILGNFYTKAEVDAMVAEALEEARRIDEASMAEHNFKATIISMILGGLCLALFVDGLLRLLGIIPPFADIDISIVDKIAEKVETEVLPLVQQAKGYIPRI
jgi:hypothetical protein